MKSKEYKQSSYPKGSEWRRWDLHVHTPESKLGTSFKGVSWDEYLDALEKASIEDEIAAIGVTDYMTIDGYERVLAARNDNAAPRLGSVRLVLPNIELRVMPMTKDGKALNVHVLVDPSDPQHVTKIKDAFRQLRYENGGQTYGCHRDELVRFGKTLKPELNDDDAYAHGISQFKPSYESLMKWLRSEKWLRENCLIGVANGKDGISGLPTDGFSATRDELLRFTDFVFSGNPNDRQYYLGQKAGDSPENIVKQYGGLKPCLHGSDAHETGKLFKPDEDRFCWIKSDPTFEGLRQVLWEPESRVHIGKVSPGQVDVSKVISSLEIADANGWFEAGDIPLNPGLVAIIGEKGSGKTAVADLVAFACGAPLNDSSQASFVTKARLHLGGVKPEVTWGSTAKTFGVLINSPHDVARPLVRYLSQDFVERLCSSDTQGADLQKEIEEVVFSYLNDAQKEGSSSFEDLRSSRESASQARREKFRGDLATLHKEIERLQDAIAQKPAKIAQKKQVSGEIEELQKQLPTVTAHADQVILGKLAIERISLASAERERNAKNKRRRSYERVLSEYDSIKANVGSQIDALFESSELDGLEENTRARFKPQWDATIETDLKKAVEALSSEIRAIQGDESAIAPNGTAIFDITARINSLNEFVSQDDVNKKRLVELQRQIGEKTSVVERLTKEIEELEGGMSKLLDKKEKDRLDCYTNFFASLMEDEKGLVELYAPMKKKLEALGQHMMFELSVGYRVDHKPWLEKASRFYDSRKSHSSQTRDEIEKLVLESMIPAWKSGDLAKIGETFTKFASAVDPVRFMSRCAAPRLKLVDLYDWMFSVDHVEITYKIRYGGTELEYLSPGTRGIALLVLYLLMDEDDSRPLVIDQPEGNLDNSSVYEQLVPYIRRAKEKRQIILVTHNPNLVVATDAEQVIVATALRRDDQTYPRISYRSGSLEHVGNADEPGMRDAVCILLEGGARAFQEREARYSLPNA
ncbi:hypothetical protein Undi14_01350 [Undibacterium sp. 14-3-2]|uniref:TrlF family AAA-like ATPase n=1 Tax=Undibacterium sp. 14-3-2 TaxID=2800129 RepID=UPI00190403B0|nr:hypothetical protein [Undibacterium sp. 14-3-2]MBK1888662.1 hypothetical protein [Undibacterium sp. 14-3-2]